MTILSYHPCFVADRNRLCAGRPPDDGDRAAIQAATAVILPQGCPPALYAMARRHCPRVFPDYDRRFAYPGKTGQIRLFREFGAAHPATCCFDGVAALEKACPRWADTPPMAPPFVFKFDWGGEGETVFPVETAAGLPPLVKRAAAYERSGYRGFLVQERVRTDNRCLRVVVVGKRILSYWRVREGADAFCVNLGGGGRIDERADPGLQRRGRADVAAFCGRTGINLAGFDLVFPGGPRAPAPLFLEINWFFGRSGLGGSEAFYRLLNGEIENWLRDLRRFSRPESTRDPDGP